jgi:NtrC-family two-component system sensor histidine kinase KinB
MPSIEFAVRALPLIILILWVLTLMAAAGLGYRAARRALRSGSDPQRRIEQLSALNQVGQALSASLRLDDLLEKIYQQVSRLMDASLFYVALRDPFTDIISFPLAMEKGQPWTLESRKVGNGLTEYVMRSRQPLLIPSDFADKLRELGVELIGRLPRSWLGVPMIAGDEVLGVIAVQSLERERAYEPEHVELLQTIAAQAAVAAANARLHENTDNALTRRVDELAARNRQLSEILRLGNVLKFNLQLEDIFDRVTHAVVDSLGFNIAVLNLVEPGPPPYVRRAAAAGIPPEAWRKMQAVTAPLDDYLALMRPEFRISQSYLVSHHYREVWQSLPDVYFPDLGPRAEGEWMAEDGLLVPLADSSGQLMGILSVDDPVDRRIPARETIEALEVFANQASIAIEGAWLFRRLAEGRDRLQAILNSTRDGMIMIDTAGCILVANNMVGEMFGIPPNELAGRCVADLVSTWETHSGPRAVLWELLNQVMSELAARSTETVRGVAQINEPRRIVECVSSPMMDTSNAPVARLLVLYDVTGQKDAEALREDMTRMMVHDLRNPLTNIIAALDVLELAVTGDEDKRIVELAHAGTDRLMGLINSLLEISKLEARQMPLNRKPVAWDWLVETARERVQVIADSAGVVMRVNVPPGLPQADADADVILRVLVNLLDNAIHFSPPGAAVEVSVVWAEDRPVAECRVHDQGLGIPVEYRERIFLKFYQMPGPRRRRGTGLGLPFCRLAVEAHGGRIWAEENSGGGSVFVFTLPVVK